MQVSEIMHKGIVTANINDSVKKVAELMKNEDIGALPVMEENKPVGFVTDRDIVISCIAEGYDIEKSISHAMSENIISVKEDEEIEEVNRLMQKNQISRVLVVDEQEQPIGIVSLKDIASLQDEDLSGETVTRIKEP